MWRKGEKTEREWGRNRERGETEVDMQEEMRQYSERKREGERRS